MDKELSVARQEEPRQPVLLADSRAGVPGEDTTRGNKRKKKSGDAKGLKRPAAKNTSKASKGSTTAKGSNGRGRPRRGRTYSLRESIRDAERTDITSGRSAAELGIEYPEDRCSLSPSRAHYFICRTNISKGGVFKCRYCHQVKWLPFDMGAAQQLGLAMKKLGTLPAYQQALDANPAAKRLIYKVQSIFYLRKVLTDATFGIAVAAIMLDREFPYDIELTEADVT